MASINSVNKFKVLLSKNKILLGVLFLAAILRLWGISYGFPNILFNDERALVYGALKMMELKTLIPAFHPEEFKVLYYLPAMSYVYLIYLAPLIVLKYLFAGLPDFSIFKAGLILDPTFLWYSARFLNALIGVLGVYAVYKISSVFFKNKRAAIFSALFLAFSFYHIQLSHMSRHWIPAVSFTFLALVFAALIYKNPKTSYYVWGGIFGGLAVGTNPISAIVALPLFLAHIFNQKLLSRKLLIGVVVFAAVVAMFVALHPYGLTLGEGDARAGVSLLKRVTIFFERGLGDFWDLNWKFIKTLLVYETTLFILGILGLVLIFKKDRKIFYLLFSFLAGYVALLYAMNITYLTRPVLYMIPVFAISAGLLLDYVILKVETKKTLRDLILAAVFVFPLILGVKYDWLLAKNDSRILAMEWLGKNLPGEKILAYLPYMQLTNTREGVTELTSISPESLRVNEKLLKSLPDDSWPQPSYNLLNLHFLPQGHEWRQKNDLDYFARLGYKYIVLEYRNIDKSDLDKQILLLSAQGRLVKKFRGDLDVMDEVSASPFALFNSERLGPVVEIYEIGDSD